MLRFRTRESERFATVGWTGIAPRRSGIRECRTPQKALLVQSAYFQSISADGE